MPRKITSPPRRFDQSKADPDRRLVSIEKAAAYLDTSPRTIRRSIAEGRLTGYRFGPRLIRVSLSEVDAALRPIPTAGGAA